MIDMQLIINFNYILAHNLANVNDIVKKFNFNTII